MSGEGFIYLHPFIGEDYENMDSTLDVLAEFVLTMGYKPPTLLSQYLSISTTKEAPECCDIPQLLDMIVARHEVFGEQAKDVFNIATEIEGNDIANYMADRQDYHYKQLWKYKMESGVQLPSAFSKGLKTN